MIGILFGGICLLFFGGEWMMYGMDIPRGISIFLCILAISLGLEIYFKLEAPEAPTFNIGRVFEDEQGKWRYTFYDAFGTEITSPNKYSRYSWAYSAMKAHCGQSI